MAAARMLAEFPRLLPSRLSPNPRSFHGFVTIGMRDYEVHVETPNFPSSQGMSISSEADVLIGLKNFKDEMCEVRHIVDEGSGAVSMLPAAQQSLFSCLLSHLELIGWDRVSNISSDFSTVTFEVVDRGERTHFLKVHIGGSYPVQAPEVDVDLPLDFKFSWNPKEGLCSLLPTWEEQLDVLQPFWDKMDELDAMAFILDPPSPSRKHTIRRLLLDNHISIQLKVSPIHPSSQPQCHMFGPPDLVTPLTAQLEDHYEEWDLSRSIIDNLEAVLGVHVVKSTDQRGDGSLLVTEEWNLECAVCYCLHLGEELPDSVCSHCQQAFHVQCLYDWLRSLPNSRQSFQLIIGECPYCTKAISCKVPSVPSKQQLADVYSG